MSKHKLNFSAHYLKIPKVMVVLIYEQKYPYPSRGRNISSRHHVQTDAEAHPISHPNITGDFYPRGKTSTS
jgi:hypothetical protein